jgi:hypothetical protein
MFKQTLAIVTAIAMTTTMMSFEGADCAKILAAFPTPSYSHHSVYKVFIEALADRGHEIVVLKSTKKVKYEGAKIREIDASPADDYFNSLVRESSVFKKRGVVADSSTVTAQNYIGIANMVAYQFQLPAVKTFLDNDANEKFDLIICEAFTDYTLILSHLFNDAPVVQISSGYGVAENFETMGAVSRHPIFYPNLWRDTFVDSNTWDTIKQIYTELKLYNEFQSLEDKQNVMLKRRFGADAPTIKQLRDRVQLLLINVHHALDNNRPVPPSVQYLGALHLNGKNLHRKKLDSYVKRYLDNSTRGAVYVSFGSSISTKDMEKEFIDMLLDTFESLPYDVLWKFDDYKMLTRTPDNVLVQSWFDQYQLLKHDKVKAFVTQGGVQSMDEAIDAAVPLVGMPMMGDQFFNAHKFAQLNIGCVVDTATVTSEELARAIKNVASNERFKHKIIELRHFLRKQQVKPIDKAIWHTEQVIEVVARKNGSSTLLKTKAANVDYSEYMMSYVFLKMCAYTLMIHIAKILNSGMITY